MIQKFANGEWKAKPIRPVGQILKEAGLKPDDLKNSNPRDYILNSINKNRDEVTLGNIGGKPLYDNPAFGEGLVSEEDKPEIFTRIRTCCNIIKLFAQDMLSSFDQLEVGYAVKINQLRYTL